MNELWQAFNLRALRRSLVVNFILVLIVLSIGYAIMHVGLKRNMTSYVVNDLQSNLNFIARPFHNTNLETLISWCQEIPRNSEKRISLIDHDGKVHCDNYADIETLVNHSDRPEFITALEVGEASSVRNSTTSSQLMVYAAKSLVDQRSGKRMVLRIALPGKNLSTHLNQFYILVIKSFSLVLGVFIIIFAWSSIRIAIPLKALERKLSIFKNFTGDKNHVSTQLSDEWENVDYTIDQIYRDLTTKIDEIDRSNDKISTIIESIADGLLAVEQNEKILFGNATFIKDFNISESSLKTKSLLEVIRDVDIRNAFASSMSDQKIITIRFSRDQKKYELRVYPMLQSGAKTIGAVGIFHDITQGHLIQQMREDFVANVSHEVRTPLTAIKGYAQILTSLSNEEAAQFPAYAQKIEQNVNRLANLFQDILTLSVLESHERIDKDLVDSKEMINTTISNVSLAYQEKNIAIKQNIELESLWVEGRLFEQVITNLLDNAYKYTPNDGTIEIKVYRNHKHDCLEVSDTGIGIPESAINRIFERFYRVDESRSRNIGGTGLGLAIVKHIVNKHQGTISVSSKPNLGTKFIVQIPAKV